MERAGLEYAVYDFYRAMGADVMPDWRLGQRCVGIKKRHVPGHVPFFWFIRPSCGSSPG
jgi:hypothetical protein